MWTADHGDDFTDKFLCLCLKEIVFLIKNGWFDICLRCEEC